MSSTCNVTDSHKKRIETLFTRFTVFYGHLWRSQFKSDGFLEFAKQEWLEGLKPFNDDTLNQAILECRDIIKHTTFYTAPQAVAPARQEVVEASLKKCREILFKQQ